MAATQKVRDERAEMDETTPDGSGLGLRTHFGGGQTTGFGVSDERRTHCCKEGASQGNAHAVSSGYRGVLRTALPLRTLVWPPAFWLR